ncbi:MAG: fasciclin domain-containing protein, partial [Bauldia litoralis]
KAAGLVETLQGPGPFTVFAPTNAAFSQLPPGTVETLLKPENKAALQKVLTAHVVPASVMAGDLIKMIKADGGKHAIKTVSGDMLYATLKNGSVYITDESGRTGKVTIANVTQSNGVIHVVDTVLLPK